MNTIYHTSRSRKFGAAFAVTAGLLGGVYASAFTGGADIQQFEQFHQCCDVRSAYAAVVSGVPHSPTAPQTPRPVDRSNTPEQVVGDMVALGNLPMIVAGLVVVLLVLVGCLVVLLRRRDK